MNIIESALNFGFLWLSGRQSPVAILVGFSAVVMTASKTVLYWLVDHVRTRLSLKARLSQDERRT